MTHKQPDLSTRELRIAHIEEWLKKHLMRQEIAELQKGSSTPPAHAPRKSPVAGRAGNVIPLPLRDSEETCSSCSTKLGFSSFLHINDPLRWKEKRMYIEGAGQLCGTCAERIYSDKVRFDAGCD
jgi:hypothetical protein